MLLYINLTKLRGLFKIKILIIFITSNEPLFYPAEKLIMAIKSKIKARRFLRKCIITYFCERCSWPTCKCKFQKDDRCIAGRVNQKNEAIYISENFGTIDNMIKLLFDCFLIKANII